MSVGDAIREAASRLAAVSDTARLDAELLMAHALRASRSDMLIRHMTDPAPEAFAALFERRVAHEPVAHITGIQEFYCRPFKVSRDVLIPRGDSETLIEAALELAPDAGRILDLGTGSGALLVTALLELPEAMGVGIDASPSALEMAIANARALGLDEDKAQFQSGDWRQAGWSDGLGQFDLILCNPPYVEEDAALDPQVRDFEPAEALFAGPEGLDDYRALVPQLRGLMREDGTAILEIGSDQAEAVMQIARAHGFTVEIRHDLAKRPRALVLH
ncbi:peptide chain release factor N(5)-glutamine methyltransferase [uncultured Erythrobacter sp.]|uniref:peptide chain release factor N(5)-glutamine methyltransferase n=1 Tax=uncultured Erythrobacter sp. TaxID=263913 RepID=UPI00260B1BF8|nr:peptide chain release factor N(5)-glutamine methyltransferase [uncultured Erythrobacter sp.]